MAEGNRLDLSDALIREVGGADDAADHPENEAGDENRPKNGDAGERVRATVEYLRH
jgi:hypothetical protein